MSQNFASHEVRSSRTGALLTARRLGIVVAKLDRSKPMCKQIPPPCNQFYLTSRGCGNPKCQYGHNYQLKEADLQEMRCVYLIPCSVFTVSQG